MNELYIEMLARLVAYRMKHNLNQRRFGKMMGMSQSQCCKVEQGKKRLTGIAMVNLSNCNVDMDALLTGEETLVTELNKYFQACKEEYREELLRQMMWLVNRGTGMMNKREEWGSVDDIQEAELLHLKAKDAKAGENIWYGIRQMKHYTQQQMADILDVNIKKYRTFEKENRIPDAEVLINLHAKTGILPSVLIKGKVSNLNALNHIWVRFAPDVKERLLKMLDMACTLFGGDDTEH